MAVDVLLGLQWGDEGKGKIVDNLAENYDIVARFQGGPNAGHTLKIGEETVVLHQVPSGVLHPDTINVLGAGMVIDPVKLMEECATLEKFFGIYLHENNFMVAREAHLILPTHILLDRHNEGITNCAIGSTQRGMAPAYKDRVGRHGIRIGDIAERGFLDKVIALTAMHKLQLPPAMHDEIPALLTRWLELVDHITQEFAFIDSVAYFNDALLAKKFILAEGAQGALLDVNFGTYPYVTSSSTVTGGVCTGLGIPPQAINIVKGVTKAYTTRVGNGPFPTELFDETGALLQQLGGEKGATTGRLRRCGWLDIPLLARAIQLTGTTELIITKLDILQQVPEFKICVAYEKNGKLLTEMPMSLEGITPRYETYNTVSDLDSFVEMFSGEVIRLLRNAGCRNVRTTLVSTGPTRDALTVMA